VHRSIRLGDRVEMVGLGETVVSVATGLETFGQTMDHAEAGDNTAVLLREITIAEGGMALPGDTVTMTVSLGRAIALDEGLGFAIREGRRTVGAGTVTALLD
jgi:elongation factor Tu